MKKRQQKRKGICIITLSNNYDHQECAFSMFNELVSSYNVYCIGLTNQKNPRSPKESDRCFYYNAPRRPGITLKTFNFIELFKIIKKINSLDVEYVYFESEHIWNALIMMFLKKKIKKVEVIHDVIPHSDSKGKNLANKVTCKLADFVLIRNEKYRQELINRYKVKEEKIIVIPLWRYYPKFEANEKADGFLFFGRMRKYKGLDEMLTIAKECPNIKFNVIGKSDDESKPMVDLMSKLENVNVVDREVSDEEMEQYFKNNKAIILPYESATQSGVIVDAYKYSKPVIAYNVGAISEQIENDVSGYLVESNNTKLFEEKISLLNDMGSNEYCALQKSAYDYGFNKYSVSKNKEIFIEMFLKEKN